MCSGWRGWGGGGTVQMDGSGIKDGTLAGNSALTLASDYISPWCTPPRLDARILGLTARVTPGVVICRLYCSHYSRRILRTKQQTCRFGQNDIDKARGFGAKLFGGALSKLDKALSRLNTKQIAYDIFGFPHESLHTARKCAVVRRKQPRVQRTPSHPADPRFALLRAFSLPEYAHSAQPSVMVFLSIVSWRTKHGSICPQRFYGDQEIVRNFPRPGQLSLWFCLNSAGFAASG